MYAASVPVFKQMLGALSEVLNKASIQASEQSMDAAALLQARLFEDMFPLVRQVQIACDFAKGVAARLAGADVPAFEDTEQSFDELQQRIAKTLAFVDGLDAASFAGSESLDIVLRPGTPKERKLDGQSYLLAYGLPQFFFHVTTAYALLRHKGIVIGKRDYMGAY
jgi:uncharacterized protein